MLNLFKGFNYRDCSIIALKKKVRGTLSFFIKDI